MSAQEYASLFESLARARPDPPAARCARFPQTIPETPGWGAPARIADAHGLLDRLALGPRLVALVTAADLVLGTWADWARDCPACGAAGVCAAGAALAHFGRAAGGAESAHRTALAEPVNAYCDRLGELQHATRFASPAAPRSAARALDALVRTGLVLSAAFGAPGHQATTPVATHARKALLAAAGVRAEALRESLPRAERLPVAATTRDWLRGWWWRCRCRLAFADAPVAVLV